MQTKKSVLNKMNEMLWSFRWQETDFLSNVLKPLDQKLRQQMCTNAFDEWNFDSILSFVESIYIKRASASLTLISLFKHRNFFFDRNSEWWGFFRKEHTRKMNGNMSK